MSGFENFQRFDIGPARCEETTESVVSRSSSSFYFARDFRKDSRHAEK